MDANSIARIDAHTGRVSLVQQLDYEGERSYQLFVTASDLAVPRLSSRVPLRVQVSDYNDNAPVFQRASLIGKQHNNNNNNNNFTPLSCRHGVRGSGGGLLCAAGVCDRQRLRN